MSAYFFRCQDTVVKSYLVEAALQVGEVVVAAPKEELRVTFRVGTGELAIDIGLGVSVEVDPDALALTYHDDVMPALWFNFGQPGQKPFALVSLVDEEPASRGIGSSNSEVIALGFLHAVDAPRKEIGGHGTAVIGQAVAKPELDAVGIADTIDFRPHATALERIAILIGGHGPSSFLKFTVVSLGCAILGRLTQAPESNGLGLHDRLGVGIGGPALHRRPWWRRLRRRSYAGERMKALGVLSG